MSESVIARRIWANAPVVFRQRITSNIRLVRSAAKNSSATIEFFFDGPVSEDHSRLVGSEMCIRDRKNSSATIEFFFDGPVSEDDEENVSEMETEFMSHFYEETIECIITRADCPSIIEVSRGEDILYARKESENYIKRV